LVIGKTISSMLGQLRKSNRPPGRNKVNFSWDIRLVA